MGALARGNNRRALPAFHCSRDLGHAGDHVHRPEHPRHGDAAWVNLADITRRVATQATDAVAPAYRTAFERDVARRSIPRAT